MATSLRHTSGNITSMRANMPRPVPGWNARCYYFAPTKSRRAISNWQTNVYLKPPPTKPTAVSSTKCVKVLLAGRIFLLRRIFVIKFASRLATTAILKPKPPHHDQRLPHNVTGHFRVSFHALGKDDRHL